MKAIVANYRGSYRHQQQKQMIVKPIGVETRGEAEKLVGKKVIWTSPAGKKIEGKVSAPHGGKGAVRVIFAEKGLPGQSLGQQVDLE